VLTVAVKVLTEGTLVSRTWVKFSNCDLTCIDAPGAPCSRLTVIDPEITFTE
jgi:hypothetical protein